jgi:CDP-glycerol glycerophosphotransferase (TagB/SpsB family)
MKILIWATTFGADLWAFARYLDRRPDCDVRVVMQDPGKYRREGINQLEPLGMELRARRPWSQVLGVPFLSPDVTIMDNHVPLRPLAPKGFVLWHGFGWKGPNDEKEFAALHWQLRLNWGSAKRPNARFRWQTFGPWDFKHRTEVSGFHRDNCRVLGAASHDLLREPWDKRRLQQHYPFDVVNRPTVLIAPTWHYGEVFAHWGADRELFPRLLSLLDRRGVNVILRLHDSFRFEKPYLKFLQGLVGRYQNTLLKFKDHHPDNLLDLQVADALVTNFSSIANLYYATGRPTVHIYPVRSADEAFIWRTLGLGGVRTRELPSVRYVWKLPPEENGGLLARSFEELLTQLEQSLDDPDCCADRTQDFLDRHMLGADGRSCERIFEALSELCEA